MKSNLVELYSSISIQDAYGWCPEHGVRVPTVQVRHRCDDTMWAQRKDRAVYSLRYCNMPWTWIAFYALKA